MTNISSFIHLGGPPPPSPPPVGGPTPGGPSAGGSKRPPPPPSKENKPSAPEGRGDLMASIPAGIQLKSVDSSGGGGGAAPADVPEETGGMVGDLSRVLAARSDVIQGSGE